MKNIFGAKTKKCNNCGTAIGPFYKRIVEVPFARAAKRFCTNEGACFLRKLKNGIQRTKK